MKTLYINSVHVRDTHGNIAHTIFDEWSDEIWLSVKDVRGFNLTYEGEAKHLRDWCKDWCLQLRHDILELEIPNPFDLEIID
jgi:hypothetical protein